MLRVIAPPYGIDLWQVARIDVQQLDETHQKELYAWLTELGVPYRRCIPKLCITQDTKGGQLLLHLSQFALTADDAKYIDHAANRMHTEPVAYVIDAYPVWLPGASLHQATEEKEEKHDDDAGAH